ncbi:DUF308 domain-containing protein [Williamsia deligens]|uniref:DUF308 domain-containing protein n=1 Tax=Williamsia deligens TaxID=321325 RepID=A0ABW3GBH9_9NOCA|nr:DUF308 domain-containing protein [Williamsia deligens]MCP2192950.1 Uncharacterized membrane protein HdeD, DUF308 family [Williamsia deligens]
MTHSTTRTPSEFLTGLRAVYAVRSAFAVVWALALVVAMPHVGPLLTALLVIYPVVDAGAVYVQSRSGRPASTPRVTERINIVVSVVVAVAVGVASTTSVAAAVGVWGAWAMLSGVAQLITALQRRQAGGQIAQIVSGAISVVAGLTFLAQAAQGTDSVTSVGGYALLGGFFFLVSAIHMTMILRRTAMHA